MEKAYLISVFVIATCGLVYELISGALASYLLGDSVTQFSMVIGVYLFSMGIGSYLSKFITKNLEETFIKVGKGHRMSPAFPEQMAAKFFSHQKEKGD